MVKNTFEILDEYKGTKGFFIKSFLYDDTFNLRNWRVTKEAIIRDTHTFLDKQFHDQSAPFIIRDDRVHPEPGMGESMIDLQEPDRVGNIIDFGFEERNFSDGATIRAWQVSDLSEELGKTEKHKARILAAQKLIREKQVQFISPSVRAVEEVIDDEGRAIVTRFIGSHNAGVDQPAYGMQKAQIKGVCEGDPGTCMHQLKNVQASIKEKLSIELLPCGSITIKSASKELNKLLTTKITTSQNITFNDFIASLELLKVGGMDQISLDNITNPKLLLKKKDAVGNKSTKYADLKGKTNENKTIPMTSKQAQEVDPSDDGSCPEGFVKGENGKCIMTAAAYIAAQEEEKKTPPKDESGTDDESDEDETDETASEVEKLKEEQAGMKKMLHDEIKKPLVASIMKGKSMLGLVKSADSGKLEKSLFSRNIADLKTLNADVSELVKNAGKNIEDEHSEESSMNFEMSSHSASEGSGGEPKKYSFVESIRENMQS